RDQVLLYFADTLWEDPELYCFLGDCHRRWGGYLWHVSDGRTPPQVWEQRQLIPNNLHAPCSYELKIAPFLLLLRALPRPLTCYLGMDWREPQRHEAPRARYGRLGVEVVYPLAEVPELRAIAAGGTRYHDYIEDEWGIPAPRLYRLGFPHNNCGGRCCR